MHGPITPPFTIDFPIFTPSVLDDIPIKKHHLKFNGLV
jgi:hypothetical protein